MSTITKERIEQYANDPRMCNVNDEIRQIALIALASLEAEAVGEVVLGEYDDCGCHPYARVACIAADGQADWENFKDGTRLYTAPPAPVSVPDAMEMDDDFDSAFEHGKAVGWNAYRAAMLQAEPVSNSDELPLDYLQGHKDGLEWAAQLAEANHPQTGDWLYDDPIDLARAIRKGPDMPTVQGGNSPVIPDGWVMVPVEPTIAILDELDSIIDYGAEDSKDAWSRLLAAAWIKSLPAAPRQEVNRG